MQPEWAPSGTHYLLSRSFTGVNQRVIEDQSATEGFSRRVVDEPPDARDYASSPRWAPDGTRFLFVQHAAGRNQLAISSASGGAFTELAELNGAGAHAWSPDGQWVAFARAEGGKQRLVKDEAGREGDSHRFGKCRSGSDHLFHDSVVSRGRLDRLSICEWDVHDLAGWFPPSAKLTARKLLAFAFSKEGAQVMASSEARRPRAGSGGFTRLM